MLPIKSYVTKSLAAMLLGVGLATAIQVAADPAPRKQAVQAKQVADTVIEFAPYVNVTVGKSTLLKLPAPAARISVANPAVADIRLINPREVYLLGKSIGSTNITLWSKSGRSTQVDVTVGADIVGLQSRLKEILPNERDIRVHAARETLVLTGTVQGGLSKEKAGQLAEAYAGKRVLNYLGEPEKIGEGLGVDIARKINDLLDLPAGTIHVTEVGNTFVLRGVVSDAVKVNKAVEIAKAVAIAEKEKRNEAFDIQISEGSSDQPGTSGDKTASQSVQFTNRQLTERESIGNIEIINFLSVGSAQQVMLEVKVAEVSKNLLDQLGGQFSHTSTNFSLLSSFLFGTGGAIAGLGGALTLQSDSGNNKLAIDAQKKDGLVKILAEPNIMAISGQDGEFHAGGRIFIPVLQGGGANNAIQLEERDFGVRVKFTPTVLEDGLINLRVRPEVSELSASGTEVTAAGTRSVLPSFTVRSAATTVQLRDGQSFAIGGLIKNNVTETVKRFPILGEIPILGVLFRSSEFQHDKTELLFVVTPRLVKPLQPDYALPTDSFKEPSRSEFMLEGKMEGKEPQPQPEQTEAPAAKEEPAPQPEGDTGFEMK